MDECFHELHVFWYTHAVNILVSTNLLSSPSNKSLNTLRPRIARAVAWTLAHCALICSRQGGHWTWFANVQSHSLFNYLSDMREEPLEWEPHNRLAPSVWCLWSSHRELLNLSLNCLLIGWLSIALPPPLATSLASGY